MSDMNNNNFTAGIPPSSNITKCLDYHVCNNVPRRETKYQPILERYCDRETNGLIQLLLVVVLVVLAYQYIFKKK